ncbi:MAG: hypothetical protein KDC34_17445, partial [Saprospiraceae bacterium]|nr:hypothetical protein [Saprospiraceae bacterium]
FFNLSFAQSYDDLISQAEKQYQDQAYEESTKTYLQAFDLKTDQSAGDLYNAACSAALSGDDQTAFVLLDKSYKAGYSNARHLKQDSDLQSLHDQKKWKRLTARVQRKLDKIESAYNKPLQQELLRIYEDDQQIRREFISAANELGWEHPTVDSLGKIMSHLDSINLERTILILDEYGWVGPSLVGGQASQSLFLVIQHADLETQQKYLPMMRTAVEKGDANTKSLALLEDRVALREGRKQIYGSQIGRNPDTNEQYVLPLEDPDNVDVRRAKMGLGTMQEYVSRWNLTWDATVYKSRLAEYESWYQKE